MLKNKLTTALHVTNPYARKVSPWVGIATMFIIAANDLKKTK